MSPASRKDSDVEMFSSEDEDSPDLGGSSDDLDSEIDERTYVRLY